MKNCLKIFALVLIMGTTSCSVLLGLRHFELKGAEVVRFDMSGAEVEMTIRNKSLFKVTLVDGLLAAYDGDTPIVLVALLSIPVAIVARIKPDQTLKFQ